MGKRILEGNIIYAILFGMLVAAAFLVYIDYTKRYCGGASISGFQNMDRPYDIVVA
jgi:hypothetical protein